MSDDNRVDNLSPEMKKFYADLLQKIKSYGPGDDSVLRNNSIRIATLVHTVVEACVAVITEDMSRVSPPASKLSSDDVNMLGISFADSILIGVFRAFSDRMERTTQSYMTKELHHTVQQKVEEMINYEFDKATDEVMKEKQLGFLFNAPGDDSIN